MTMKESLQATFYAFGIIAAGFIILYIGMIRVPGGTDNPTVILRDEDIGTLALYSCRKVCNEYKGKTIEHIYLATEYIDFE